MINVKNLDKTYYKGKSNEIHVIQNTSLELPDTGLVCFLGASGSGKTTLLNTIGGLDKANKGEISYGDTVFKRYSMDRMDSFRSKNFGYIFQNYLLMEDLSVTENLRLALELIGITDKEEVKKRIEYVLKAVGLYRFRRKPAGQLSGGQQQRVSIARALIKKTKVIIADEPTGNLDSENTVEVMNILKKISKEALVLVVTHNNEIAEFYADRIIRLKDGVVESDTMNQSTGSLDLSNGNKIHLLDLKEDVICTEAASLELYSDGSEEKHKITIVIKNNTVYIDSPSRVQLVSGSSVSLVKDHYKKLETAEVDSFSFDNSWYNDTVSGGVLARFFRSLGAAFSNFFHGPKRRKFLNIVFGLIGMTIAFLVIFQTNYSHVDLSDVPTEEDWYLIYDPDQYYSWSTPANEEILREAALEGWVDYMSGPSATLTFNIRKNSVEKDSFIMAGHIYPHDVIMNQSMIAGTYPKKNRDLVVGKLLADEMLKRMSSLVTYDGLIGLKTSNGEYTIVGISSIESKSYYMYNYVPAFPEYHLDLTGRIQLRSSYSSPDLEIVYGRDIAADDEIITSIGCGLVYDSEFEIDGKTYKVVGQFTAKDWDIVAFTQDVNLVHYRYDCGEFEQRRIQALPKNYPVLNKNLFPYTIYDGHDANNANECIASIYTSVSIGDKIGGLTVVGRFIPNEVEFKANNRGCEESWETLSLLLGNAEASLYQMVHYRDSYGEYVYHITDVEQVRSLAEKTGYTVESLHSYYLRTTIGDSQEEKKIFPIIEAILLCIILVYTYFSERAKMLSDIYDIGVLRSLGAKRSRVIIKGLMDGFVKATMTTLLGYVITFVGYYFLAKKINDLTGTNDMVINPLYLILGVVILYASQLLIGILPYVFLLGKTPSEINSKYDI